MISVYGIDAAQDTDHAANLVYFGDVLKAAGRTAEGCAAFMKSAATVAAVTKAGGAGANPGRLSEVQRNLKSRLPCKD